MYNFKNKNIGIIGLGLTGISAINFFRSNSKKIIAWDDTKEKRNNIILNEIEVLDLNLTKNLKQVELLFVSPGIKPNHKILKLAKKYDINIIGDLDIFWQKESKNNNKFIFITGSNGKSTVTALIHHLLTSAKIQSTIGGNIGVPVLNLKSGLKSNIFIIEASSFQLNTIKNIKPNMSILTNISPDHIDWHGSYEGYISAKENLFSKQDSNDIAIINIDSEEALKVCNRIKNRKVKPNIIQISLNKKLKNTIYFKEGKVFDNLDNRNVLIADIKKLTFLIGQHNVENILLSIASVKHYGVTNKQIIKYLPSFKGLRHRLELVYKDSKLKIVNDSKATNLVSCKVALNCFENIIWIAGGIRKDDKFSYLKDNISSIKAAYFIGESADEFISYFGDHFYCKNAKNIKNAVKYAINYSKNIRENSTILFSPACASYDQFLNYEERGIYFSNEVNKYLN